MAIAREFVAISPVAEKDFADFFSYLDSHLARNGKDGTPLFQPAHRGNSGYPPEKKTGFIQGLAIPVGESGWRRAWRALDDNGHTIGHVDLRARPEPCTAHRALLGMGVRKDMCRRGIGNALLEFGLAWARESGTIEIVDLSVMAGNLPAIKLYEKAGFLRMCQINDMFRIDGRSEGDITMMKQLR